MFAKNRRGQVEVWVDGACSRNGMAGALGGCGVYFGPNHSLNQGFRASRATNNCAEIEAATRAIEVAKDYGVTKLLIYTDSEFVINCVESWMFQWKRNGWKTSDGKRVINKEELKELDIAMNNINVEFQKVQGHSGNVGNEAADRIARQHAM